MNANGNPEGPPKQGASEDLVAFAERYAKQLRGLAAVVKAEPDTPAELWEPIAADADVRLRELQTAVTQALGGKNMDRAKALTTAKNHLYEALRLLRTAAGDEGATHAADRAAVKPPPPGAVDEAVASALSRAGKAKDAQRKAERKQELRASARKAEPTRPAASSIDAEPVRRWQIVVLVLGLGAAAFGGWFFFGRGARTQAGESTNHPPVMKSVTLVESTQGVVASAAAEDADRDRLAFSFVWRVNGRVVGDEQGATLPGDSFKRGDRVTVEVTASDGRIRSGPMTSGELVAVALSSVPKKRL